jgi:hypothetical protein
LRHFFGSTQSELNTPPRVIQDMMGHKDFRTTSGYIKQVAQAHIEAAQKMQNVVFPQVLEQSPQSEKVKTWTKSTGKSTGEGLEQVTAKCKNLGKANGIKGFNGGR